MTEPVTLPLLSLPPAEYYLYVESSRTLPNETAALRSGEISGQFPGYCLQFWYHMFGANIGTLRLLTQVNNTEPGATLWQHSGDSGNVWYKQAIYVRSPGQNFRVSSVCAVSGPKKIDSAKSFWPRLWGEYCLCCSKSKV